MVGFVIILLGIMGALGVYLLLLKRELRSIVRQLQFIREHDTNQKLSLRLQVKEITELAKNLNHLISQYKLEKAALAKAQQKFKEEITNLSHDLRTPVTSISGYVQMLEAEKVSPAKKAEYFGVVRGRIETLIRMLDEFFEFARIESDEYPLQLEKINASQVLVEVLALFYEDFVAKGEEPSLQIPSRPMIIQADRDALARIFQNLIKNYLNHGTGSLRIAVEEEEGGVSLRFQNQAPDLGEGEVERLFERFYTADRSRTKKTTGLGMAIVKNLANKMKGRVEAHLQDGVLTIRISFPHGEAGQDL